LAQAGELDLSFGEDGVAVTAVVPEYGEMTRGIARYADGRIIVVGTTNTDQVDDPSKGFACRYFENGTIDPNFGDSGAVLLDYAFGFEEFNDAVVLPNNRVLVAGSHWGRCAVYKFTNFGDLDDSFGVFGASIITYDNESVFAATSIALQPDGKMVLACRKSNGGVMTGALVRMNEDGSLDETFGTGGVAAPYLGGTWSEFRDMVLLPDGKILAVGMQFGPGDPGDFLMARYDATGQLDPAFGTDGVVLTNFDLDNDQAACLAVRPDGRIVVGGTSYQVDELDYALCLAQYMPDGSLDPSFGSGGLVVSDDDQYPELAQEMALQGDGKILTVGDGFLRRYSALGALDPTFSTDGVVIAGGSAMALQPDGKILVGGSAYGIYNVPDPAVRRFLPDHSAIGMDEVVWGTGTLSINPCPADDVVSVAGEGLGAGPVRFEVVDINGRVALTIPEYSLMATRTQRRVLDIAGLASGTYVLKAIGTRATATGMVLKR